MSVGTIPSSLEREPKNWGFCRALLPRVSRTFALSIEALPTGLQEPVRTAYLLCRIVDTVEDQPDLGSQERGELYATFDLALKRVGRGDEEGGYEAARSFEALAAASRLDADGAGGELCRQALAVFTDYAALPATQREAILAPVVTMSRGMREFSERAAREGRLRLRDIEDLERYCYYVAGTVGELLTSLFEGHVSGLAEPARLALRARAVSFGLGLQMVNIVKDVAQDHQRGDVFLPESLARAEGISLDELLHPTRRSAALAVVRQVSAIARRHLERAQEYVLLWPSGEGRAVRLFCAVPLALALATLREVDSGERTVRVNAEPKISRGTVAQLLLEVGRAIDDDRALAALLERCARGAIG